MTAVEVQDLEPVLRELLGDLRGRVPPEATILRRLRELNPRYRLTFTPATLDRVVGTTTIPGQPPLWHVHELRPGNKHDALRAAAAAAALARYQHSYSQVDPMKRQARAWALEDKLRGYWEVGAWPDYGVAGCAAFGSDRFFHELAECEASYRKLQQQIDTQAKYDELADGEVAQEVEENPAFAAAFKERCRTAAQEDWSLIFRGKLSRIVQGYKLTGLEELIHAGTNGQRVAGPGRPQEAGQPGQHHHERVPGARRPEPAEVRPGRPGPGADRHH